jgi:putative hydrolase of the HAD superfamily
MDYRTESMKHLEKLKKRYSLYLLSNTNILHHEQFNSILFNQLQVTSLDSYFTKAYYSHQTGMRKPDNKIYEFVLNDAGIKAERTLFIDDLPENIATAQMLGFQTRLLLPEERIENLKSLSF